jgi:hypothetical protein
MSPVRNFFSARGAELSESDAQAEERGAQARTGWLVASPALSDALLSHCDARI